MLQGGWPTGKKVSISTDGDSSNRRRENHERLGPGRSLALFQQLGLIPPHHRHRYAAAAVAAVCQRQRRRLFARASSTLIVLIPCPSSRSLFLLMADSRVKGAAR